jgi:polar amino acid transport system substrate-binding protein
MFLGNFAFDSSTGMVMQPKDMIVAFGLWAFASANALATPLAPEVKICDDAAGWPPYTFADHKDPRVVRGASADLIVEILRRAGYSASITLLPWKRCLRDVETGAMAMLLNASYSEDRAKTYLLSQPYYKLHSALYYTTARFPVRPSIKTIADMQKYKYCGLLGYNYSMYAITDVMLDTSARTEASRFNMLRAERCDFAIGDIELVTAFAAMGQVDLSGTAYIPIPGAKPKDFHVLISRNDAGSEKLLKVIDNGIKDLKADKTYARIFSKYGI